MSAGFEDVTSEYKPANQFNFQIQKGASDISLQVFHSGGQWVSIATPTFVSDD